MEIKMVPPILQIDFFDDTLSNRGRREQFLLGLHSTSWSCLLFQNSCRAFLTVLQNFVFF